MTPHPLVLQLRFARSELRRALEGVSDADARCRFMPMNCLSWIVMHLACQEQFFWLISAQNTIVNPHIYKLAGYGQPPSTPPFADAWEAWEAVTKASDVWLDTLTPTMLTTSMCAEEQQEGETIGSIMQRVIYHYWYHIGESQAIRQLLGHQNLPEFVGAVQDEAPYTPENDKLLRFDRTHTK